MRLDKAKLVIYLELQYLLLSCICSLDIPQVYFNMYQNIPGLEFWEKLWTEVLKSPGNEDEILICTVDNLINAYIVDIQLSSYETAA